MRLLGLRGGSSSDKGTSLLLNNQGNKCCLGFDALACGLKPRHIQEKIGPTSLQHLAPSRPLADYFDTWSGENEVFAELAMLINDSPEFKSNKGRFTLLKFIFNHLGIKLELTPGDNGEK